MNIVEIRVSTAVNDLSGKVWNPLIRWTKKYAVFVELETETGLVGLGECWCFDDQPDTLATFLRTEVAPHIIGERIEKVHDIMSALVQRATLTARHGLLRSALSGIDIALWDLRSKADGIPLYQAIDGQSGNRVELYASGGLYGQDKSADDLAKELSAYLSLGFDTVKMKVGGLEIDADAERVSRARKAIGPKARLIIDGVYSFSYDRALALFDRVRKDYITAFQSPVRIDELRAMRRLCDQGVPVMAAEAEYRSEVFAELIEGGAVAILQVAPIACGGITSTLELADRAERAGIALSLEVSSTAVATMAAAHIGAAHSAIGPVEYHMVHQLFFEHLPFRATGLRGSAVSLPDAPGLGIDLPLGRVTDAFRLCAA